MMRIRGFIFGVVSVLAGIPIATKGVDRPIVAVFNIEAKGVKLSADVLDRLTDYLGSLMATQGYRIVPRSELKKRLLEQKKASYNMCYDTSCQLDLGKELAAEKSLATQLISLGGTCKLTLTLYDLKKATSEYGGFESGGCDEKDIVGSLESAIQKMGSRSGTITSQNTEVKQQMSIEKRSSPLKEKSEPEWLYSKPAKMEFTKSEITVAQYRECVDAGKCSTPKGRSEDKECNWGHQDRSDHPINCVDWNQTDAFCRWAGGRLPTVEEWYAEASDSGKRKYPWGNQDMTCVYAVWFQNGSGCGKGSTWPVCSKPKGNSVSGLCDMSGNVWEWTSSQMGVAREVRGGSWYYFYPDSLLAAFRQWYETSFWSLNFGFRCVRSSR
jgi:hypothetical protein